MRCLFCLALIACGSDADADLLIGTQLRLDGEPIPRSIDGDPVLTLHGPLWDGVEAPFTWVDLRSNAQVYTIEVEPPLLLTHDDSDPLFPITLLGCAPTEPGAFDAAITLTVPDQPDVAHTSVVTCVGDASWELDRTTLHEADGRRWQPEDIGITTTGQVANAAVGGGLVELNSSQVVFIDDSGERIHPASVRFDRGWRVGDDLLFNDATAGTVPSRMTPDGAVTPLDIPGLLHWATPDGRYLLWSQGNQPVSVYVRDTVDGTDTEVLDANGSRPVYYQILDAYAGLSTDGRYVWLESGFLDRDTGLFTPFDDLWGHHYDQLLDMGFWHDDGVFNAYAWQLSEDGTRLLISFQTLDASSMLPSGAATYVVDATEARAWFVDDWPWRTLRKESAIDHGVLSADGTAAYVGDARKTEPAWQEVTP